MEYFKLRPHKTWFSIQEQERLTSAAIEEIQQLLLPDQHIHKITLIGSSLQGTFGQYEKPGFRGSLYSDFDFIVFIEQSYKIPTWLEREPDGKPFAQDDLNLAYRSRKFLEDKYDAEVFFIYIDNLQQPQIIEEAEAAGIPISVASQHSHLIVYSKK